MDTNISPSPFPTNHQLTFIIPIKMVRTWGIPHVQRPKQLHGNRNLPIVHIKFTQPRPISTQRGNAQRNFDKFLRGHLEATVTKKVFKIPPKQPSTTSPSMRSLGTNLPSALGPSDAGTISRPGMNKSVYR